MKIALVVGHRYNKQGAYGNAGVSEFKFWDEFLHLSVGFFSLEHEYKIFYREDNLNGYGERMKDLHKRIDDWGADVSVSFHFNGFSDPTVNGHEVLYCSNSGKRLAKKLDDIFDDKLGNSDRGIKRRTKKQRGGGFLCRGKSKCILVEPFFASHQDKYIYNGEYRDDLVNSFVEFFETI